MRKNFWIFVVLALLSAFYVLPCVAAQHDYVLDNNSGSAFRADLNGVLGAVATNNAGATAPATLYANMWWYDTSTGQLKRRNNANDAWIILGLEAASTDGTFAANSDNLVPTQKSAKTYIDAMAGTKAAKGANSDITSLSGLTTPLSILQGGTGSTTGISGGRTELTGTGSWTVPAGIYYIFVNAVGGGGGGGGCYNASNPPGRQGAGGGGGAYVKGGILMTTPGESLAYSVGVGGAGGLADATHSYPGTAGGDTTIGEFTCNGGGGGEGSKVNQGALGGAGGALNTAQPGVAGTSGVGSSAQYSGAGGVSGKSPSSGGAAIGAQSGNSNGNPGTGYGAGGGGANLYTGGSSYFTGGAGSGGFLAISW